MHFKNKYRQYFLCVLTLFLCQGICFSQLSIDTVSFGEVHDFDKKQISASLIGEGGSIWTSIKGKDLSTVNISQHDNQTMKKINEFSWSKESEEHLDVQIIRTEYLNENLLLFYSSINKQRDRQSFWIASLSNIGEELSNTLVKQIDYLKKSEDYTFEVFKSQSGNFIGISSVIENYKESRFDIELLLLDINLTIKQERQLILPNIKKVDFPSHFIVSDNGSIFFLNGLTDSKSEKTAEIGLEKRLYQLFRYDPNLDKLKQYDVSIADKYISDVSMKLNKNGDLYVLGFYNNSYYKGAEGIFLMLIDKDSGKIRLSGKKPIDKKILSDFLTEKQLRKRYSVDDLFLDHIHIKENGNIIIIGEIFYVDQRLMTGANGISVTTSKYYNFEEILLMELTASLSYVQHQTIYKKQKSINFLSAYWGYSFIDPGNSDDLYIVFNYSNPRKEKSSVTVTNPSRTSIWVQKLFSSEPTKIDRSDLLRVAPLYNPIWESDYLIVQDNKQYGLVQFNF